MDNAKYKKIRLREAAMGGLILGLWLSGVSLLSYVADFAGRNIIALPNLLNIVGWVTLIFIFTKRVASAYGDRGFSYGQSMGFIIIMMLFAGFIHGTGQWLLYMHDPDYYISIIEVALGEAGIPDSQTEEMLKVTQIMYNPVVMIFSGIMSMLIYGGLTGLLISAFTKRQPKNIDSNNLKDEQ